MRSRLLLFLLPMLVLLGAPSAASAVVTATVTVQDSISAVPATAVTVAQDVVLTLKVETSGADTIDAGSSVEVAGASGFSIQQLSESATQDSPSGSGNSRTVPVQLDTNSSAEWLIELRAPSSANTAFSVPPIQLSQASAGVPIPAVPELFVRPVVVSMTSPSQVAFPGVGMLSGLFGGQIAVEPAQGAPSLTRSVTVTPGVSNGVTANPVSTTSSAPTSLTYSASATAGTATFGTAGTVVAVGSTTLPPSSVDLTPATFVIAPRPALSVSGLPASLKVGESVPLTVELDNSASDIAKQTNQLSVALASSGLTLSDANWASGLLARGRVTKSITATAATPGVGTVRASYLLGGESAQEVQTQILPQPPAIVPPAGPRTLVLGFRVGSRNPFKRPTRRPGFNGQIVDLSSGSAAALPSSWCNTSRLKVQLRFQRQDPGAQKWVAAGSTARPALKFRAGACQVEWGQGIRLNAYKRNTKLRYLLRIIPVGTVSGYATPTEPKINANSLIVRIG